MQIRIWEPRLMPHGHPGSTDLNDRQYIRHILTPPPGDALRVVNVTWHLTPEGDTLVDIETENLSRDRTHLGTGDADPGTQSE